MMAESIAGSFLLDDVVEGGTAQAIFYAIMISVLNVLILGAGFGLLASYVQRTLSSRFFGGFCALAFVLALGFNWYTAAERDRMYADSVRISQEQGASTESVSREYLPWEWEYKSLIFFGIGMALWGLGLYKGLTFHGPLSSPRKSEAEQLENARQRNLEVHQEKTLKIKHQIESLPEEYRRRLHEALRSEVGDWVGDKLEPEWRKACLEFEGLEDKWQADSLRVSIEVLFLSAYNRHHAEPISQEMLDQNRADFGWESSLPEMSVFKKDLDSAEEIIREWKEAGRDLFFEELHTQAVEIRRMWIAPRMSMLDEVDNMYLTG